jgi:hypothetical protein
MRTRFRTLLLAGAASLAVSAAALAQTTINGSPSPISQIVKMVWNTQDISATNPLPVALSGTGSSTTSGALQPPTAAAGKITQTRVAVAATTSTQLVAANTARIAVEIQCDGTAPVGIDRTGAALTDPLAAPLVIPSGSYPLYTMPIATLTAITAYTATAQSCRVTEYLR